LPEGKNAHRDGISKFIPKIMFGDKILYNITSGEK